jgi:hypothetical protein
MPTPVGSLGREKVVERVLAPAGPPARSAWNAADVRGEDEQLLAEDLTARALSRCLPLLDRDGVPEHVLGDHHARRLLAPLADRGGPHRAAAGDLMAAALRTSADHPRTKSS